MDPGTDAREVIAGRVVPLRRGFVPVVCRSQKDIAESMPIVREAVRVVRCGASAPYLSLPSTPIQATGLQRETVFFARHYAYKSMASRCGSSYLTRALSHMLFLVRTPSRGARHRTAYS